MSNFKHRPSKEESINIRSRIYLEKVIEKIFLNDHAIHFLNHLKIDSIGFSVCSHSFHKYLTHLPYKNNLTCGLCDEEKRENADRKKECNKYTMIYEFLKKKIGPDCSRLVVYKTLEEDIKISTTIKPETKINDITNKLYKYFMYSNYAFSKYTSLYSNDGNGYLNIRLDIAFKDGGIATVNM